MKKSIQSPNRKSATSSMLNRARLVSGISAIAAVGFCPNVGHAAELDFAAMANAVEAAQAAPIQTGTGERLVSRFSAASGVSDVDIYVAPSANAPILSVGLVNHERSVIVGEKASFIGYSNYPAAIARGELRIFDAAAALDGSPHAVVPFDSNGAATWTPTSYASSDMRYTYRVYDSFGRMDETASQPLEVLPAGAMPTPGAVSRPTFGIVDSAQSREIAASQFVPLSVSGKVGELGSTLMVEGQVVPVAADGSFAVNILQPVGCDAVKLTVRNSCGDLAQLSMAAAQWQAKPVAAPPVAIGSFVPAQLDGGLRISRQPADQPVANDYGIEVRADGHAAEPVMSIGLIGSERVIVQGEPARFQTYTNYPTYVVSGEVRIFAGTSITDAKPLAVVETDANGVAEWQPTAETPRELFYVYRVYDKKGHFDETKPEELTLLPEAVKIDSAPVTRPTFGVIDEASVRNIQLNRTATITVSGVADPDKDTVRVGGQLVPVNPDGQFITKQLVDRDVTDVKVAVENGGRTAFSTTRDVVVPRSDWFFVGQADLTFRSMDGGGPAVEVSGDPLADGNSLTSRAAFYTKGKFGDGWKLTASLDTGETLLKDIFNNLDRKDPRQLLRRMNSNEYFTTYGDDSVLVEDAPTQGQFYLKVQKDDSSLMVGNYVVNMNQAELAPLDRGLFGIALDHKSVATTSFGERKNQLTVFASDPGTIPARDEFRGTGGSLYFLQRQDLTVGSERVRVEVRDRDTGIVLETRELRPQEDYDIDYFQGRVTLMRPLASTAATGSTVRESSSTGNVPVLVVRYEYTPTVASLDGYTVGGRGSAWLGDKVRLGLTAQKETTDTADQTLLGADAMLRLTAGTYVKGEIAQTDGPAFGQANSVDGGLTFTDFAAPGTAGRKARAWRVEGGVNFGELRGLTGDHGQMSAYFESFDAGFAASSQLTQSDTTRWGAAVALPIGDNTNASAKYEELQSAAAGTRRVGSFDLAQKFAGGIEAKLGLRHDDQVPGLLYNSVEAGKRTDAALQLGYNPQGKNWSVYGFGQATLQHDATRRSNSRFGVGGKAEISDRMSLAAEVSGGEGGLGADAQLSRRYGNGSEAYIGYSLLADRTDTGLEPVNLFTRSNRGTFTVGARHRFNSALSIYGENRIGHGGTAPSTMRSFGAKFDPNEKLSFSASFENGKVDDATTGIFRRTAGTFGFGYSTKDVQFGSNVEARFERGVGRDQTVWLFRNTASVQVDPDWRALGRLNVAVAEDNGSSLRAADYIEGVVGFAYRPVLNDRLNILARANYFHDLGPVGQITSGGETNSPKQRSMIGVIDINYDLTDSLTLGGKYGYRQGKVSLDRTSDQFVSSNTHLGVLRLDWRPVKQWDAVVEGHYLSNDLAGDSRWGGLAAIYRHLGENAKIGVGYSISDFSDDLTDQSYSSKGFFINLLGKF
ncbi:hypothetical protein [uncultured Sphingorhabdus sp.]|uniref:hypothetical protein n=1 Tax=uncultured Sphingorhabdus sp. TaxID=1686106 RepID=UPI002635793B|nr:hypothetical protein [uncultured Sphingorhabdus sp.]HMS20074.1 hypothetical protein [Sphingorhabdus sp.]